MLFGSNGRAFTGGYTTLQNADQVDHYYFLSNGQAFTTGYKTVKEGDTTHYYYFEKDGKAFTGGLKQVPFGTTTYRYYFGSDGKAITNTWQTAGGTRYYFTANGRAAKDTFLNIDGKIYFFNAASQYPKNTWFTIGDGYYYADDQGALLTNTVKEGYKLDATGKTNTKYRMRYYASQLTNDSMTDQEKIRAIFNWILKNDMVYYRTYEHTKSDWVWKDSWVDDMAASQLDQWGGNCFRYNALLGMLIREATGLPVMVYHGMTPAIRGGLTPHGWATVLQDGVWYIYDVELQKHAGASESRCYKVPADQSSTHREGVGSKIY